MKWTPEAEAALRDLKSYLSSTPTLVVPSPQEPLLLYLAATNQVVSAALVVQNEVSSKGADVAEPPSDESHLSQVKPSIDNERETQADASNRKVLDRKKMV